MSSLSGRAIRRTLARQVAADPLMVVALGILAAVALLHARQYSGIVIDDAFVTFRHARNLIDGHGFTCDPGERIEGTSSPLLSLLVVLPLALGADPYATATWITTAAFAACCVVAYLGVRAGAQHRYADWLGLLAAGAVAGTSRLAFHSQTGMETTLFALLLATGGWLQLRSQRHERGSVAWAAVMALAALTRPEGLGLFVAMWLIGLSRRSRSRALRELAVFVAMLGPYLVFRRLYFATWLPNSVLAKSGVLDTYGGVPWYEGVWWMGHGLAAERFRGVLEQNPVAALLLTGTLASRTTLRAGIWVAAVTGGCFAVTVWNGMDWMPYERLLVPMFAPLAMGSALGLGNLLLRPDGSPRLGHWPSVVTMGVVAASMVMQAYRPLARQVAAVDLAHARDLGERLARVSRSDDRAASDMAGVLPYYWGIPTIDMYGPCDAHIARHGTLIPAIGKTDPAYVAAQHPTFYAFNTAWAASAFYRAQLSGASPGYRWLRLPERYFVAGRFEPPTILVREDRPGSDELERAVDGQLVDAGEEIRRRRLVTAGGGRAQ